jgi:hypothetical protein
VDREAAGAGAVLDAEHRCVSLVREKAVLRSRIG